MIFSPPAIYPDSRRRYSHPHTPHRTLCTHTSLTLTHPHRTLCTHTHTHISLTLTHPNRTLCTHRVCDTRLSHPHTSSLHSMHSHISLTLTHPHRTLCTHTYLSPSHILIALYAHTHISLTLTHPHRTLCTHRVRDTHISHPHTPSSHSMHTVCVCDTRLSPQSCPNLSSSWTRGQTKRLLKSIHRFLTPTHGHQALHARGIQMRQQPFGCCCMHH